MNGKISAQFMWELKHVGVRKQQPEPTNYYLQILEYLSIQETDFFGIYSLAQVLQLYLVDVSSIC